MNSRRSRSRFSLWLFALGTISAVVLLGNRGVTAQGEVGEKAGEGAVESPKVSKEQAPAPLGRDVSSARVGKVDEKVREMLRKGKAAVSKNQLGVARSEFEKVLEQAPDDLTALVTLGWIDQREQQWEQAETHLRRALKLSVEDASIWLALGLATLEQGKLEAATAAFAQTVALDPKNARARRFLGLTLGKRGWLDGAEQEIRKSLEIDPDDAGAHFNLAVFYLQRRPPTLELARRHYYKARDLGFAADLELEAQLAKGSVR